MKKIFTICLFFAAVGYMNAQTTLFSENFDALTADQFVNTQQPLLWPWTGATAEKAYVRNTQSHTPSNSMKIVNDNDMIFDFGGKSSGEYNVSFWMFVDSAKGGYFNIEHAFGTTWAVDFFFKPAGTCDIKEGGLTHTFNYALKTWFHLEFNVNLEQDSIATIVDGTQVAKWKFSNTVTAAAGTNVLDVIDFYGLHDAAQGVSNSSYYIDDFEYIEIQSGLLPPTISIDTTTISTTGLANETLPFSNTGETVMNFNAYPTFIDPSLAGTHVDGTMKYDQGSLSAIGWASEFEVYAATRFLPNKAVNYLGQNIVSATIFINDAPVGDSIRVYVWKKGEYAVPGTGAILAEKAFTVVAAMDNTILFDTPVPIDGDEIWVGYKFTTPANQYTLGTDTAATVPFTSYLKTGPVWSEFDGVGGNMQGNFAIRADVTGLGWPAWLAVAPYSGTVAATANQDLTLSFNTTGLTTGTYEADVVVGCNDPAKEWSTVHVILDFVVSIGNVPSVGVMTYPNPTTDFYSIISDNMISKVTVYSLDGKMIKNLTPGSKTVSVDVNDLSNGTYIFEITSGNQTIKRNVVVK